MLLIGIVLAVGGMGTALWNGARFYSVTTVEQQPVLAPQGQELQLSPTGAVRQVQREVRCLPVRHYVGREQAPCKDEDARRMRPAAVGLALFAVGAVLMGVGTGRREPDSRTAPEGER